MIDKQFIDFVSKKLSIGRQELIEKDIIIHSILQELTNDFMFKEAFVFKGGTCLIKCYFGYYRFSEDLDFTYINQKEFEGKPEKAIRNLLSEKINVIMKLLSDISFKYGLEFKADKTNNNYIEYGGSNKLVTFKIWYNSTILNKKTFIKIQINFIEKILYPLTIKKVNSIIDKNLSKDVSFLFNEYSYLFESISINAYSLDEILIEKIRAIMTRKSIKIRDFIDIYFIQKERNFNLKLLEKKIIYKVQFSLRYEKYLQNIKNKVEELEQELVLGKEFKVFFEEIKLFLVECIKNILNITEKD